MESVDRLRDVIKDQIIHPHEWIVMVDAIEAEVAERYVELPVDKDGRPIRPGDTVRGSDGHRWHVTYIRIGRTHSIRATDGSVAKALRPEWLTHERTVTVESLLRELLGCYNILLDPNVEAPVITRCAAKLRLADGGDAS